MASYASNGMSSVSVLLPAAVERVLVVTVPEGVLLLDKSRKDDREKERLAALLQVFLQFAREIDQGELSVVHFGLQHPLNLASPGSLSNLNLSIPAPKFGTLSVRQKILSSQGRSDNYLQTMMISMVVKRADSFLVGIFYTSPTSQPVNLLQQMKALSEQLAVSFGLHFVSVLEQLRPQLRSYKNDSDEKRSDLDELIANTVRPFLQQLEFEAYIRNDGPLTPLTPV